LSPFKFAPQTDEKPPKDAKFASTLSSSRELSDCQSCTFKFKFLRGPSLTSPVGCEMVRQTCQGKSQQWENVMATYKSNSDRVPAHILELAESAKAGEVSRREFLAMASIFGASTAMAYGMLGLAAPTPAMAQD